ncbi:MAG: glycosyltransferase family 1 protein [Pyrinomonadaceae bacterium]
MTPEAARRSFRPATRDEISEARRRLKIDDDFLLFVGTIEPRKNLITLVKAFEQVLGASSASSWRPQLVIAGKEGWLTDELFAYINKAGLKERIKITGYITEDDLRALYSACEMCLYPSLYEGFGLPTLEAMACGAPVITSRVASLIETVGDAARLIDPLDASGLARAILELHQDEGARQHFSAAGLARARQFTWERTAEMTRAVYEEAMKR